MRKVDQLLEEYGASHKNSTNKAIHWICVPLIFFSIVGLVWSIPHETLAQVLGSQGNTFVNWATAAIAVVLIYYFTLSLPLMFGMAIFSLGCLYLANFLEQLNLAPLWAISIGIFVIAWIGQFYGHKVEGKKPSFIKDVQFLLIGPAWLMHFIYKKLGVPY